MLATIVLAVVVAALVLREVFDAKKKKREKIEAELKSRTMPSGLILPENEECLLAYRERDLVKWDDQDIKFLINYASYKYAACEDKAKKESWRILIDEAKHTVNVAKKLLHNL